MLKIIVIAAIACALIGAFVYDRLRKRRRRVRHRERRRRNMGHALAWNLFMVPKRTKRLEYHAKED